MRNIWEEITSQTALEIAFGKVKENDGCAGVDGETIYEFELFLKRNIKQLNQQLRDGTYEADGYRKFEISKKSGSIRTLMVPTVKDRIVHTAIAQKLTPIFEPLFENCSFAYRPGRSVKQAIAKIEYWRNSGYVHVVEADIKDYFNSIEHKRLNEIIKVSLDSSLENNVDCSQLIEFLQAAFSHQSKALNAYKNEAPRGLVQGSPLSPLLANLYLDRLDEEINEHGVKIVRFADDFVLLCKKEARSEKALIHLKSIIASLGLELNMAKTKLVSFDEGFEFLGYLFLRSLAVKKSKKDITSKTLNAENNTQSAEYNSNHKAIRNSKEIAKSVNEKQNAKQDTLDSNIAAKTPIVEDTQKQTKPPLSKRHALGDRILYVIEKGRKIHTDNHAIYVSTPADNEVMTIASNRIDRIVLGNDINIDRDFIDHCSENKTSLTFINGWGETKATLITPEDDHAALQFEQAKICADETSAALLSQKIVEARIRNQRTQLLRLNRKASSASVEKALDAMQYNLRKLEKAKSVSVIRGIEGASGAIYWPALASLCLVNEGRFKRTRPAKTPLNATINYLTYMLERDTRSALRFHGLHCGFGFLHTPKNYSQSAVYDLMEPFRAPLSEGLAIFLFNAKRLKLEMFSTLEDGAIRMNREAQRAIIRGYESAVARRINVTGKKYKLAYRLMMRKQASDLAKAYKKGDIHLFQPYWMEA